MPEHARGPEADKSVIPKFNCPGPIHIPCGIDRHISIKDPSPNTPKTPLQLPDRLINGVQDHVIMDHTFQNKENIQTSLPEKNHDGPRSAQTPSQTPCLPINEDHGNKVMVQSFQNTDKTQKSAPQLNQDVKDIGYI